MVRLGRAASDQFLPHAHGEGNIDQAVPVHMANFAVANPEFGAAKTVRSSGDWVSVYLRKPGDVARALELLRRSYEMALASGAGKTETG